MCLVLDHMLRLKKVARAFIVLAVLFDFLFAPIVTQLFASIAEQVPKAHAQIAKYQSQLG